MRAPNHEQRPAIEHTGGVLLRAGAGSGKTFVLVEHMLHRTRSWREDWEREEREVSFADYLAQRFSETVLMTFTKLAAGEILVRLTARFRQQAAEGEESERAWWLEACGQLDRLIVTTIDGFFYKLVRRGYFSHLPPDVTIIMEGPRRKKLLALFDVWWERHAPVDQHGIVQALAMHRDTLSATLLEIFNDPSLRDVWMGFNPQDAHPDKIDSLAAEVAVLEEWNSFMEQLPPQVGGKIATLAKELERRRAPIKTWAQVLTWSEFIQTDVGRSRMVFTKEDKEVAKPYFDRWKLFRDSMVEWGSSFDRYRAAFEDKIKPWLGVLTELVRFMDQHLDPAEGLTYGDLEYQVLRALRVPATARRVQKDFNCFVVDEFQDTSRVQYEILRLMTAGEGRRLFCVGDAKQAIYGFRGGELQVFLDLMEEPGVRTLMLGHNYRSSARVVGFNNALFTALFPLGTGWEGIDPHAVEMEPQSVPPEKMDGSEGRVVILQVALPDVRDLVPTERDKKKPYWKTDTIHRAEGLVLADVIEERLKRPGSIAVLYKRLAPSNALMTELMARGIGFTAQAKIPFSQDPVSGLLNVLLEDELSHKEGAWAGFMIRGYLRLLRIEPGDEVEAAIANFCNDGKLYGLEAAFDLFMARLGLANGLHDVNAAQVRETIQLGGGERAQVWALLSSRADERWSADFRFGRDPSRVILQTSHGSKGLEYDVVLLGGMATNGWENPRKEWIGSLPGAAQWVEDAQTREIGATPQLLYEKALSSRKNFAESKRLFYVACTRAREELIIPRFVPIEGQFTSKALTWAQGLEAFLQVAAPNLFDRVEAASFAHRWHAEAGGGPFFHRNPLGLTRREHSTSVAGQAVLSELSVTRLGALLECPRKFYFKNILRFPEPEDDQRRLPALGEEVGELRALSSSERGSALHEVLSRAIQHNLVLPLEWEGKPEEKNLRWALSELRTRVVGGAELISEVPLKFPLFGFMLTGIPDLLVLNGPVGAEVWDFKTGRRGESKELKYWQQLEAYAYSLWISGRVAAADTIILRLAYLDEKTFVDRSVNYDEVKTSLFNGWQSLSHLHQAKLDHCPVCPYQNLCPR